MKDTLPKFLAAFEKRLAGNSSPGFFVGEKLTIADFVFFNYFFSYVFNPEAKGTELIKPVVEAFPMVMAYSEALKATFKEYLKTRPNKPL